MGKPQAGRGHGEAVKKAYKLGKPQAGQTTERQDLKPTSRQGDRPRERPRLERPTSWQDQHVWIKSQSTGIAIDDLRTKT
ncbi:hypothetical protein V496_08878 [Pseudogymnoascus sp. VKM F-4515 (FW-2607)]|nr:hypothetical protein V496_08878 [Pseudogymnoascus sp. VKM F-4515 (FW-2607)]